MFIRPLHTADQQHAELILVCVADSVIGQFPRQAAYLEIALEQLEKQVMLYKPLILGNPVLHIAVFIHQLTESTFQQMKFVVPPRIFHASRHRC